METAAVGRKPGRFAVILNVLRRLRFFDPPVLRREFIAALRMPRAFWLLFVIATFSALTCLLAWAAEAGTSLSGRGLGYEVFSWFGVALLLLCLSLVPALASSAFAGERDRGTFELLLAAPVRPVSIAFSKLAATTGYVLLILASTAPLALVLHTAGGIEFSEIGISYLIILAYTGMGGCIGLSMSSRAPTVAKAAVRSLGLTFFYAFVLPGMLILLVLMGMSVASSVTPGGIAPPEVVLSYLVLLIPVVPIVAAEHISASFVSAVPYWIVPLAYAWLIAAGHLARVFLVIRRAEAVLAGSKARKKPRPRRPPIRSILVLAERLARSGVELPVFVKEVLTQPALRRRRILLETGVYSALCLLVTVPPAFLMRDDYDYVYFLRGMTVVFLILWSLYLLFRGAATGAAAVAGERDRGTLDFLLVSPLGAGGFLGGKLLAAFLSSIHLLLALWAGFGGVWLVTGLTRSEGIAELVSHYFESRFSAAAALLAAVAVPLLTWSLAWALGAFFSAGARSTATALAWTLGALFCLEVGVQFFGWLVLGLLGRPEWDSPPAAMLSGLNPFMTLWLAASGTPWSDLSLLVFTFVYGFGTACFAILAGVRLRASRAA